MYIVTWGVWLWTGPPSDWSLPLWAHEMCQYHASAIRWFYPAASLLFPWSGTATRRRLRMNYAIISQFTFNSEYQHWSFSFVYAFQIKSTLKHIQEHPFPEITVFQDNRPRCYRKDENGQWIYTHTRTDSFRFQQIPWTLTEESA